MPRTAAGSPLLPAVFTWKANGLLPKEERNICMVLCGIPVVKPQKVRYSHNVST